MKTPYLIQRMSFKEKTEARNFDAVISMDYMGSSEFEFGALPASLKVLAKAADGLVLRMFKSYTDCEGRRLCIVACSEADIDEYAGFIDELAKGMKCEYRTKEMTYFQEAMTGKDCMGKNYSERLVKAEAWWDIVNHVIFTFGKDRAERIVDAVRATRDAKKAEGKAEWF